MESIYYDVDEGVGSVRDLYEKARKVDVGMTLDMVSTWTRAQPKKQTRNTIPTLHRSRSMNFNLTCWMSPVCCETYVGSEIKGQLRYGLVCIDIFRKISHSPYRE